ncbi:MAG: glycoside hydrolase family 3 C-terminal domain-containing protein [Bilifractor sp.]
MKDRINDKVNNILQSLTLEEKASLCQGQSFWFTKALEAHGIESIMMTDGPHGLRKQTGETDHLGVNKSLPATCFPSSAAIANSWNTELIERIGTALGEECRKEQVSVLLGPGANIKRSPLCGRNFEYFSEDPYLSSHMAKHHILGVQSQGVGCSLKHFAVNSQETCRMTVDEHLDERTLREIYLASFETAVKEAKPWTIMGAYNRVNGEFCCENKHLLKDILREEWGYEGVVVSDWGAVNDQVKGIRNGFDLRMPCAGEVKNQKITDAVRKGELDEADLDRSVRRILKMILTAMENRSSQTSCDMEAHHRLAVEAACESAVLLKNQNGALPVSRDGHIAVIGALAKHMRFQGSGSSHVEPTFHRNFLEVLEQDYPEVSFSYARGYRLKQDIVDEDYVREALEEAGKADKIVLLMGMPNGWESEGFDRKHLRIPDNQIDLLKKLRASGKKICVFLFTGAPVEMEWDRDADAVFAMYTGGQGVAEAMAKLLFGEISPSGKLAESYPMKLSDTPCYLTYPQRENAVYEEGIFVGYRYYDKKEMPVKYCFGYGLSYTDFSYSGLIVDKKAAAAGEEITVGADVTNTGGMDGSEVVELYVTEKNPSVPRPVRELKGFVKVFLKAGETKHVTFVLNKRSFAYYEEKIHDWYAPTDTYVISLGKSSRDIQASVEVSITSDVRIRRHYDKFVTMGDMMKTKAGMQVISQMMGSYSAPERSEEEYQKWLWDEDDTEDVAMDYAAMGMDMPLTKVADMSEGRFSEAQVAGIVDRLNQEAEKA